MRSACRSVRSSAAARQWHVFKVVDGAAALTPVTLGHRSSRFAEVVDGLAAGDVVVLHPSDRVVDGVAVEARAVE